ncbi:MAG: hypothetical protein GC186_15680 [Rhodobacteraceae bacterium]|nr:hypothetical protein [Paracoccaceae bacterium]
MKKPSRLVILRDALTQLDAEAAVPEHLVTAARALFDRPEVPQWEVFRLFAAATGGTTEGLVCTSTSGLWTLEIFAGLAPEDRAAGRGQVLLSVHLDHRASYEGLTARIFIHGPDGETVLAEAAVVEGEAFADVSLSGLDLTGRDAVNVTFSPRSGK